MQRARAYKSNPKPAQAKNYLQVEKQGKATTL